MLKQVQATIQRYGMLPTGSRVIAAVSGGADSVCLVHVLRELGYEISGVAHLNHRLRGEASDEDEQFVAKLAAKLKLPFYTRSSFVGNLAGNLEQNARRARREFFRDLLANGRATCVALGHTRDDQAETVLFRLLRGCGPSGLSGILPITAEGLIRPLLNVTKSEIVTYLRDHNLDWREDASNRSPAFARNRIRQTLLPQLANEWNPAIGKSLAQLADVAYDEEIRWEAEIAQLAKPLMQVGDSSVELSVPSLTSLDRARLRRLIRHAVRLVKGNLKGIEFDHVESVAALATAGAGTGRMTLPGMLAVRSFDWILLAKRGALGGPVRSETVRVPGLHVWPPDKPLIKMELLLDDQGVNAYDTLGSSLVDLELRGWRPGDRYQPLGRSRETKIKELFQQARIPSWRRPSWPILTGNGKILWAKEFGPAAETSGLRMREIPLDV